MWIHQKTSSYTVVDYFVLDQQQLALCSLVFCMPLEMITDHWISINDISKQIAPPNY